MKGIDTGGSDQTTGTKSDAGMLGLFTVFLMIAVVGLAVLVLRLSSENRELKAALAAKSAAAAGVDPVREGERLGPLKLVGDQGAFTIEFDRETSPVLVMQVSPGCGFCEETMPVWAEAIRGAAVPGIRAVCVQVGARTAADLVAVETPLVQCLDAAPESSWLKRMAIVPSAVLIGRGGVVERAWMGQMNKEQGREMAAALVQAAVKFETQK